jgi:hypothetical protein
VAAIWLPVCVEEDTRNYPQIEWATTNSRHDVAGQAPQELMVAIRKFAASA